jgi:hypothetical protein
MIRICDLALAANIGRGPCGRSASQWRHLRISRIKELRDVIVNSVNLNRPSSPRSGKCRLSLREITYFHGVKIDSGIKPRYHIATRTIPTQLLVMSYHLPTLIRRKLDPISYLTSAKEFRSMLNLAAVLFVLVRECVTLTNSMHHLHSEVPS